MMTRTAVLESATSATLGVTVAVCRFLLVSTRVLVISVAGGLALAWLSSLVQVLALGRY